MHKTINHKAQQRKRDDRRRRMLALKHEKTLVTYNTISHTLERNALVEEELTSKTTTGSITNCMVQHFIDLKPAKKLEDFIHVRKFLGKNFERSKLVRPGQSLNKMLKGITTAQGIEEHCSEESPCLVWIVWRLRSADIILKAPPKPDMPALGLQMPTFTATCVGPENDKCASEYLRDTAWVNSFTSVVKGVEFMEVDDAVIAKSKLMMSAFKQRLSFHVSGRVDKRRWHHS